MALWTVAAAAITAATAGQVQKRDFATMQNALMSVNALLQQIDTSILALNQDNVATNGPNLLKLSTSIQPNLEQAASQIAESRPLSLQETLSLNTARMALNQNVNLTVSDLLKQKPLFDAAGLSGQVADEIQTVMEMSSQLFTLIQSKLDPGAPKEIDVLKDAVLATFQSTVNTFRDEPTNATGTFDGDGACICVATCAAGSFFLPSGE